MDRAAAEERRRLRARRNELRERIAREPLDLEAREGLAETYRDEGYDDQAGRWGVLIPGWTSARERELFVKVVIRTGSASSQRLRKLLLLPADHSLTGGDLGELAAAFEEAAEREVRAPSGISGWSWFANTMRLACGLALVHAVAVIAGVLSGAPNADLRVAALALTAGLTALFVLSTAIFAVVAVVRRRNRPHESAEAAD
ncbi:hypothetical protein [Rathayibacter festucae]|uniref:hypothetical protein n=1 Tax=Rathayibacter festucae TaxID=110937 RepID=UPI002A69C131|nr:hypothetical protein [Rathayibacter festucae]MDY0912311.1 hypothetical protein [Rathayibacter festucae]